MNRPANLQTKLYLDSGNPQDTDAMISSVGFVDGQTTNPSLVAKKLKAEIPDLKLSEDRLLDAYKDIIQQIAQRVPTGSISIEVYADKDTTADDMMKQARSMNAWISNAHIKLPTTTAGLEAAERLTKDGMRVNMTLVFTQEQAAAIYAATKGSQPGAVYVSPFIGRLDDLGENGMDLIRNIVRMYEPTDHHVQVLAASIRNYNHFLGCLDAKSDLVTMPLSAYQEWVDNNKTIPGDEYSYDAGDMSAIQYQELDLNADWRSFDISHPLTDKGLQKFADDWNSLLV